MSPQSQRCRHTILGRVEAHTHSKKLRRDLPITPPCAQKFSLEGRGQDRTPPSAQNSCQESEGWKILDINACRRSGQETMAESNDDFTQEANNEERIGSTTNPQRQKSSRQVLCQTQPPHKRP